MLYSLIPSSITTTVKNTVDYRNPTWYHSFVFLGRLITTYVVMYIVEIQLFRL